jgi:hypothetical protein
MIKYAFSGRVPDSCSKYNPWCPFRYQATLTFAIKNGTGQAPLCVKEQGVKLFEQVAQIDLDKVCETARKKRLVAVEERLRY